MYKPEHGRKLHVYRKHALSNFWLAGTAQEHCASCLMQSFRSHGDRFSRRQNMRCFNPRSPVSASNSIGDKHWWAQKKNWNKNTIWHCLIVSLPPIERGYVVNTLVRPYASTLGIHVWMMQLQTDSKSWFVSSNETTEFHQHVYFANLAELDWVKFNSPVRKYG